jgi:hypothetical protein
MIIIIANGQSFDTDKDLSGAERHVLQKLLIWRDLAKSLAEFREQQERALKAGWADTGPVTGGRAFRLILADLDHQVAARLRGGAG